MKEYDPENGTYQNVEVDPQTKEVHYGELNPKEDKIVYKFKNIKQFHLFSKWWFWMICAIVLITPWIVVLFINNNNDRINDEFQNKMNEVNAKIDTIIEPITNQNAGTLTIMDSSSVAEAYTEIIDTTFNGHKLNIYKVHYGIPELYVCDSTNIDTSDVNIVFAARAADIAKGDRSLLGLFIYKGEILATGSNHKEGFCAIVDSNITLGIAESTPLFEQVVEKKGYFFRNAPLISNGASCQYIDKYNQPTTRHALCAYKNEIVFITVEKTTMTDFIELLHDFKVDNAIYMVGSTGYGFCRDQEGKLHDWGKDNVPSFKNFNYLIWKKKTTN